MNKHSTIVLIFITVVYLSLTLADSTINFHFDGMIPATPCCESDRSCDCNPSPSPCPSPSPSPDPVSRLPTDSSCVRPEFNKRSINYSPSPKPFNYEGTRHVDFYPIKELISPHRYEQMLKKAERNRKLRGTECFPEFDPNKIQYIIGYGSLINEGSKRSTAPNTSDSIPVRVKGFRREWNAAGYDYGHSTTFLGAEVGTPDDEFNAVLYEIYNAADLAASDAREAFYCRDRVLLEDITFLVPGQSICEDSDVWIYALNGDETWRPTAEFPIVHSYNDLVMVGWFDLEEKYGITGLAQEYLATTDGWNEFWADDRLLPRRPWIYLPDALKIDQILWSELPDVAPLIYIE